MSHEFCTATSKGMGRTFVGNANCTCCNDRQNNNFNLPGMKIEWWEKVIFRFFRFFDFFRSSFWDFSIFCSAPLTISLSGVTSSVVPRGMKNYVVLLLLSVFIGSRSWTARIRSLRHFVLGTCDPSIEQLYSRFISQFLEFSVFFMILVSKNMEFSILKNELDL